MVSVLLRLVAALLLGDTVVALPGTFDQLSYDMLARRVLGGHGFTFGRVWWPLTQPDAPTAHWSYLYTGFLISVYGLVGPHPLAARLIQSLVVGVLHPWLSYRIGKRLFGERTGLVAAGLAAIYFYFIYYSAALMTEAFYITGILWLLDGAQRSALAAQERRLTLWHGAELGVAIALTALLRQVILLFVPFLFVWLALVTIKDKRLWLRDLQPLIAVGATTALTAALLIAPATLYNFTRFDRFVLLNTNAGYAFFWGNHPIYGTNFVGILPPDGPSYQSLIPLELRHLDEAALDQALLRRGLGFVKEDPQRYLLLSLSRSKEYFKFWPSPDSGWVSNISRVGSFGLMLPLMVVGLWHANREPSGSHSARSHPAQSRQLLYLFIIIYTGVHLSTWALIRYRLPVDAILVLFAAHGTTKLAQSLGSWIRHPGVLSHRSL